MVWRNSDEPGEGAKEIGLMISRLGDRLGIFPIQIQRPQLTSFTCKSKTEYWDFILDPQVLIQFPV
jgi:hypothetical protein